MNAHFYLLQAENEEGAVVYAQVWNNGIVRNELSISHWAEICFRSINLLEVLKLKILIEVVDNFVNRYNWKIVEFDMDFDQISVNTPKERIEYVDYYVEKPIKPEWEEILNKYRKEMEEDYDG